jgi:hypothetical protein
MDRGAGGGAMNEAEHFRRAKAHLEAGDRATAKGQEHYVSAGQHLRAIKDLSPDQATFLEKVEAKLGLGKSRTYELLAIADGTKTVEDSNAGAAKRMRDMRARRNSVRNVTDKPATTTEEPAPAPRSPPPMTSTPSMRGSSTPMPGRCKSGASNSLGVQARHWHTGRSMMALLTPTSFKWRLPFVTRGLKWFVNFNCFVNFKER